MKIWTELMRRLPELRLTPAQREIARRLAAGYPTRDIAAATGLSGERVSQEQIRLCGEYFKVLLRRRPPDAMGAGVLPKRPLRPLAPEQSLDLPNP